MEFLELIERRRSVRSYRPDPIEPDKLQQILQAAALAPTACNLQAFQILLIRTEGRAEELKRIYNKDWFTQAPLVLCVCSLPRKCWKRRDQKNYGDVDAAIVMDHIILSATSLGLGTCWIGAFDPQAAREVLRIGDEMEPIAFTPIGYAAESGAPKVRRPVEELVSER
jgi:nitroreductase